jgi:hypothetical protein
VQTAVVDLDSAARETSAELELNLLSLNIGIDAAVPAVKLPGSAD